MEKESKFGFREKDSKILSDLLEKVIIDGGGIIIKQMKLVVGDYLKHFTPDYTAIDSHSLAFVFISDFKIV